MNSIFLYFSIVFISCSSAQAQYISTSSESAFEIKNRILLVGLEEENPDVLNQYEGQPKNIEGYLISLEGKNLVLKSAIARCWAFSQNIQYMPLTQAKKLMKAEKDKYALLHFEDSGITGNWMYMDNKTERMAPFAWKKKDDALTYDKEARRAIENLTINSLVIDLPKKAIEINLPTIYPSEGDLINAIQQIQYTLNYLLVPGQTINQFYREASQRSIALKTKILLIDSRDLSYKLTKTDVPALYPFSFEVVPHDVIEKAWQEKDSRYAIVNVARFDPSNSIYSVTDASNGNLYYYKTSLTYEHGDQIGMTGMYIRPFGVTADQLTDYAPGIK